MFGVRVGSLEREQRAVAEETGDRARQATRISFGYFLRFLSLVSEFNDGDMMGGVILLAVLAANVAHLDHGADGDIYAGVESPAPDSLRRPVSVLAVSQAMNIPFETTRRHVNRLIKQGKCRRVKGGVIIPESMVGTEIASRIALENAKNLKRLYRELRRVGFDAG